MHDLEKKFVQPNEGDPGVKDSGHCTNVGEGENREGKNTHTGFYHSPSILECLWMLLGCD